MQESLFVPEHVWISIMSAVQDGAGMDSIESAVRIGTEMHLSARHGGAGLAGKK